MESMTKKGQNPRFVYHLTWWFIFTVLELVA
jgi:hypothetical protein